ncbi:response regulator [Nocardioides sp. Kera G14]|uniref:response regulator n=1 Tax=Nocardioides sp. Kera G14 TaxID=2884264 RepID=UPI001D10DB3B|nr:response regulator [Nocardioides sp. Kera G14]UDY24613.1 response regulator [Nocardioides sp. Kera G14]
MIRALIVDDDFRVANVHAALVGQVPGFEVVGMSHSAVDALSAAAELSPDLVVLDEYLPDGRGTDLAGRLGATAVILVTAANDAPTVRRAMAAGALNVVVKPFPPGLLIAKLNAFARCWTQLAGAGGLSQADVDRAFAVLHEGDAAVAPLPKGRSAVTAEAVVDALRAAGEPLTAIAVAESTGVSRATAQRYLSDLARAGRVDLRLRYGSTGRPEHEYAWRR